MGGGQPRRVAERKFLSVRPVLVDMGNRQLRFHDLLLSVTRDVDRYALWLCRDRSFAEDLVRKTVLRAWRSLGSLKDEKAVTTWLLTILRRGDASCFERVRP
jgi:RNA polymerase sigma-70 factor (ECF subfamily)